MQSKVYRAENGVAWSEKSTRLLTEKDTADLTLRVAQYAAKLIGAPAVRHVNVEYRRGSGATCHSAWNLITYGPSAQKRWIVCHEVAHLFGAGTIRKGFGWTGDLDGRGHGREWAALYIRLVQHFCSRDEATALKAAFRAANVRFTKPRAYTEEQRAAKAERARQNFAAHRSPKSTTTYAIRVEVPAAVEETEGRTHKPNGEGGFVTLPITRLSSYPAAAGWFMGHRANGSGYIRRRYNEAVIFEDGTYETSFWNGEVYEVTTREDKRLTRKTRAGAEKLLGQVPDKWRPFARIVEVES